MDRPPPSCKANAAREPVRPHFTLIRQERRKDVNHSNIGPVWGYEMEDGVFICLMCQDAMGQLLIQ